MISSTPHDVLAGALTLVHVTLRRGLETIVRVSSDSIHEQDRAGFVDFATRFTKCLRAHHDGEEEIVFPKLIEAAQRGSMAGVASDVAGWRGDHEKLLGRLSALEAAIAHFGKGGPREPLQQAARDVEALLVPHLDAEESALDGAALGKLLRPEECVELGVASSKHGQRVGGPTVLMFMIHGLTNDQQQAHFSRMPWLVRKVLVKRIWERGFQGCLKYAHNASIAL
jgi:hemerythrin-like domain-containing protein